MKKTIKGLVVLCGIVLMSAGNIVAQTNDLNDTALFPYGMFLVVEHNPEFPCGVDSLYAFLNKNIRYPQKAVEKKIEGKVFVKFVVEKDGSLTNVRVLRDIVYGSKEADGLAAELGCGAEVIRVIKMMPRWKPAVNNGKVVRVEFSLPVKFSLTEGITNPLSN